DWNVSARYGEPFIKVFREERELTVMLVVDLSGSHRFGTQEQFKQELATEVCATLAFSAIKNNDKVGLILFTDRIEKFVPAKKGRMHVLRVIRELLYHEPAGRGTDLSCALEHLNRVSRRRGVVFLVSDFQDGGYERLLRVARRRYDLIPISIGDPREMELPNVGLIELVDGETGELVLVDTASRRFREAFAARVGSANERRREIFRRMDLETIELTTGQPFVEPLMRYFRKKHARS
ncbi:MAG: VWA domain-containing protein, partial [bacterium]|nr:VWA domain-containing protein [bacterium]